MLAFKTTVLLLRCHSTLLKKLKGAGIGTSGGSGTGNGLGIIRAAVRARAHVTRLSTGHCAQSVHRASPRLINEPSTHLTIPFSAFALTVTEEGLLLFSFHRLGNKVQRG